MGIVEEWSLFPETFILNYCLVIVPRRAFSLIRSEHDREAQLDTGWIAVLDSRPPAGKGLDNADCLIA